MELGARILRIDHPYNKTDADFRTHPIGYLKEPELAYIPNLKHWYAYQIVYPLSLALVKASFLALYYRVFPPPVINRYLFWGTGGFIAVYTVIIIFVNVNDTTADSPELSLTKTGFRMSEKSFRRMEGFFPQA